MSYAIHFDSAVEPDSLARAVASAFTMDPQLIYIGDPDSLETYSGPDPDVLINPAPAGDHGFGCLLEAGDALRHATQGMSDIELATRLCRDLSCRALVDDGGLASQSWILITPDGWHGRVVVEESALDQGRLIVHHALQPVPSAPDIPVEPPPTWESGWYPDNRVPTSGYLPDRE